MDTDLQPCWKVFQTAPGGGPAHLHRLGRPGDFKTRPTTNSPAWSLRPWPTGALPGPGGGRNIGPRISAGRSMHHEKPVSLYRSSARRDIDACDRSSHRREPTLSRSTARKDSTGSRGRGPKHGSCCSDDFTAWGRLDSIEGPRYMAATASKATHRPGYRAVSAVYGKDNGLMANCHIRVATPNTIETPRCFRP